MRIHKDYWKVCTNDGTTFKSAPTLNNACPVPAGVEIPKITALRVAPGKNCTTSAGTPCTSLYSYTADTYPFNTQAEALANDYSYYKSNCK